MHSFSPKLQRARPLLGTLTSISLYNNDSGHLLALQEAFQRIEHLHRLMSFHDRNSDLGRLNQTAWKTPVTVHPDTWSVLAKAQYWAEQSAGAFDISTASTLQQWGLLPNHSTDTPANGSRSLVKGHGNYRHIVLLPDYRVYFRRPLTIDLGGIAKGYAVDVAADFLEQQGITDYLINAGGDLRIGAHPESIHIRHPGNPQQYVVLPECAHTAIATSASYFSQKFSQGRTVHALVNPFTQEPCDAHLSISVCNARCTDADALTKIIAVLGERTLPILQKTAASAYCLAENGQQFQLNALHDTNNCSTPGLSPCD